VCKNAKLLSARIGVLAADAGAYLTFHKAGRTAAHIARNIKIAPERKDP
jgi:hypothetical protein